MGFLRAEGIPEQLLLLPGFFFQLFQPPADPLLLQDKFRGRKDADAFQVLDGTLAEDVKAADGIHLIPPQLHPVRVLLRQVKNIHNAAPDGKLSRTFHLISLLIAHGHQALAQLRLVQGPSLFHIDDIRLPVPHGLRRHQRGIGGDNGDWLSLHQPAQYLHTLLHQLVAVDICLKKNQVLCRVQHDISVIKFIFLVYFLRFYVTVSNDDFNPKTIAQPIDHMQFLGVHTPGERRHRPLAVRFPCPFSDSLSDIAVFRQLLKRRQ